MANGNLTREITVDAKGEILELKRTINTMVEQLSSFAAEVTRVAKEVGTEGKLGGQAEVEGVSGTWRGLTENVNQLAGNLTTQVRAIAEVSTAVTQGDLTRSIAVEAQGEVAELKDNINEMIANLRETTKENADQDWLKTNLAGVSGLMQGQRDLKTVSSLIMSKLTPTVSAQLGAFFLAESPDGDREARDLRLIASYGYGGREHGRGPFGFGEGLVGQAALEQEIILITDPPEDYIKITSGLGEAPPANIIVLPVVFEEHVLAVIELASFRPFSDVHLQFLEQLTETIGVSLNTIIANTKREELFEQSRSLTEELQSQSAELQEKAEQLALSSKYKGDILANMSHELRTPLNSMLILSKLLADNEDHSLSEKQVEYASTIHSSGSELLSLINDILDLSKIEAGKMEVRPAPIALNAVRDFMERAFRPVAEEKGLRFEVEVGEGLPEAITTDEQLLQQILKNLLSNAFKFTALGEVTLCLKQAPDGRVAFAVRDTGVGIPEDKLRLIFEAFQQGEGGTSRTYGGTGLGLSISRENARLLGGEVDVESTPGEGSEFRLYLPPEFVPIDPEPASSALREFKDEELQASLGDRSNGQGAADPAAPAIERALATPFVPDDRATIKAGDRVLLVVCPDAERAARAIKAAAERGFKGLAASQAESGIALAHEFAPDAIVLVAEGDGTDEVSALAHLKRHPQTRHTPVYVEAAPALHQALLRAGAAGHVDRSVGGEELEIVLGELESYVEQRVRSVLVVEDDERQRTGIVELIGEGDDVLVSSVGSTEDALAELEKGSFDCVVLDLKLPDMQGFGLLEAIKKNERLQDLPVVVHTAKELTTDEETALREYADTLIVKDGSTPERLLDEASLHLHRPEARLPADKRRMLERLRNGDGIFAGKKILLVDDEVRNVFALASVLESRGMEILYAENGKAGIDLLRENPDVDLILMDIMMPEMDGYEATRRIRGMDEFRRLPIVALTAKAMKGDREKSLVAGASDYVAKPVDTDRLLSLMRVWLHG